MMFLIMRRRRVFSIRLSWQLRLESHPLDTVHERLMEVCLRVIRYMPLRVDVLHIKPSESSTNVVRVVDAAFVSILVVVCDRSEKRRRRRRSRQTRRRRQSTSNSSRLLGVEVRTKVKPFSGEGSRALALRGLAVGAPASWARMSLPEGWQGSALWQADLLRWPGVCIQWVGDVFCEGTTSKCPS